MPFAYKVPGVYREEAFQKPEALLPTGIVGFVGVAESILEKSNASSSEPVEPKVLFHQEDFDLYFKKDNSSYLADAVNGFFLNGGERCYISHTTEPTSAHFTDAVKRLAPLTDLDLIAVPDSIKLTTSEMIGFQQWLIQHCAEMGDRFAILDFPKNSDAASVLDYQKQLVANLADSRAFGAIYYPWIQIEVDRQIPSCGYVAGIYARSDAKSGFFKAPANVEVLGIFDLKPEVSFSDQEKLNPVGINCIRAIPGRGIRLMGARTLSNESEWRYINVRRLIITLRRWIDANMSWAVFEPNNIDLWVRIKRELDTYLHGLWLSGALRGQTAEQAYFVKCDEETNPSDSRDGRVMTEIGVAPIVPAEFVVVHIVHRQQLSTEAGGNV
jgi:uncharacterized protein